MKVDALFDFRVLALLACIALGMNRQIATAESTPELRLFGHDETVTRLNVTNTLAPNINLQASFNLESWFLVQSATPIHGTASFAHTNTEPIDS